MVVGQTVYTWSFEGWISVFPMNSSHFSFASSRLSRLEWLQIWVFLNVYATWFWLNPWFVFLQHISDAFHKGWMNIFFAIAYDQWTCPFYVFFSSHCIFNYFLLHIMQDMEAWMKLFYLMYSMYVCMYVCRWWINMSHIHIQHHLRNNGIHMGRECVKEDSFISLASYAGKNN